MAPPGQDAPSSEELRHHIPTPGAAGSAPEAIEESGDPPIRTYDDILAEVARSVPEFGGMSDRVILLTDMSKQEEVKAAAAEVFEELFGYAPDGLSNIQFWQAEFTLAELYEWRQALAREGWRDWTTALKISGNRVWLGILDWRYRDAAEAMLDELRIPREAIIIGQQSIPCPLDDLHDCTTDDLR